MTNHNTEVQKFLVQAREETGSVEGAYDALKEQLGIKVRLYPESNIALLDYDQINSPKSHPITIECRSLIVDMQTFDVVSRSFDRFFNAGECPDFYADFNLDRAVVCEKADGSLIKVYYNPYHGRWDVSTRGMAMAEGTHVMGRTFREMVLEAFGVDEIGLQDAFNCSQDRRALTFIFEFTSPDNRIVTPYERAEMVLLGVRHNESGLYAEIDADEASDAGLNGHLKDLQEAGLNVRLFNMFAASSIDELIAKANELTGLQEGFVVWDLASGKRMKIKSTTYLVAHKMRGENGLTPKSIYSLMFEGEVDEYLAYFPQDRSHFDQAGEKVQALLDDITEVWERTRSLETQKEFALAVKDTYGHGVLFECRKTNQAPAVVWRGMDLNKKLKLMGI